jgi:hypothetical protein
VLKDDTTLAENKVSENGFMVIMVTKVSLLLLVHTCVDAVRVVFRSSQGHLLLLLLPLRYVSKQ